MQDITVEEYLDLMDKVGIPTTREWAEWYLSLSLAEKVEGLQKRGFVELDEICRHCDRRMWSPDSDGPTCFHCGCIFLKGTLSPR